MRTQLYSEQVQRWPRAGRHILAQYDADSIIVYQAYRPAIAEYAVRNQRFGGEFSFSRMSWIKPNFVWMMYRSGWASKEGQECVLAVRLRRPFFDELLRRAVASTYHASRHASHEAWQGALAGSQVRLQWDPDHDPQGNPVQRRAVQLGLRGEVLRRYGEEELISIEDITPFVADQRQHLTGSRSALETPEEHIYLPEDAAAGENIGIDAALEGGDAHMTRVE